jgi:hypothetical protein
MKIVLRMNRYDVTVFHHGGVTGDPYPTKNSGGVIVADTISCLGYTGVRRSSESSPAIPRKENYF